MKLLLTIIILLSFTVFPQEKIKLTLEESIKIGLEKSRRINISKMKLMKAEAKLSEVNTERLPSLNFSASYTRLSDIDPFSINTQFGNFSIIENIPNSFNLRLSLRQPLFTGFRLKSASEIAEYNLLAAEEELTQAEQDLMLDIKTAYWNLYKAIMLKKIVDENVEQIKVHLTDVENFLNEGLATNNDLLKVKVQLGEVQLRQIDVVNLIKLAMLNLNNLIELPLTTEIEIAEELPEQSATGGDDLENLKEKAWQNRPELKAMEYRVKAGETGIDVAQSGWYPQLFLNGNYYYANPNQRYFPPDDKFRDSWDVSVTLSFDIWNWNKTGHQTMQAEADFEQVKDNYKILKDAISLQVTQNYLNLIQIKEKLVVSKTSVEQAEENYRVASELYKEGLLLNSELLDVEVALLQIKTNYIQTVIDYEIAKAKLERAVGE
ncbi:MAG: TolC family protein [Ignavibacteria bacterium]|nr:TolC family protein [Ignavibacteria bacterium]